MMENEETIIEEVETLQADLMSDIEIYADVTSEPVILNEEVADSTTISTGETQTTETSETSMYNDSENLQRIADNTDFGVGFLQAFVVAFLLIALYKFFKIFF